MSLTAEIVVPLPLSQTYTYQVPETIQATLKPGHRVRVSFGHRRLIGWVVSLQKGDTKDLKSIEEQIDKEPLLIPSLLQLLVWSADYYLTPIGEVLRAILPAPLLQGSLREPKPRHRKKQEDPFHRSEKLLLTSQQREVLEKISPSLLKPKKDVFLLHGVTGSGKTEVYTALIAKALSENRESLYLVPEIGLTPQLIGRLNGLFPNQIALYHSRLSPAERYSQWLKMKRREVTIVLGTRSALFAPFSNLGLIIVDEEHDGSYKQEERFRYHARDLAIVRGHQENIPVVLGSATPSLESFYNAQRKKYIYLSLPERVLGALHSKVKLIQMGHHSDTFFSPPLIEALEKNLKEKHQSLIFLNRRGFSTLSLCPACGRRALCPHCSIALTLHKKMKILKCHYCDHQQPIHTDCPDCHIPIQQLGFGTERVETELKKIFPQARITRMDRDTMAKKDAAHTLLSQMKKKEIDILIGTQMIAKGHDYPGITLVGVLASDLLLSLPDFRAAEHNFQMLMQVAGRAGRAQHSGSVLMQTFQPDHYSIRWAQDQNYLQFYQQEIAFRKELNYPPFSRLIHLKIVGHEPSIVSKTAEQIALHLRTHGPHHLMTLLGPAPCPLEKLRGQTRWQILMKTQNYTQLKPLLKETLATLVANTIPSKIKLIVDVDPIHML
ncbi:MAG: primosomal protein N' [Deltaproteobacteria bacterium RIFCSPLOWO2_02_FULL_50_16]|nr:MAG: primosomal protein N' [Deltaproteobacteria bacterium GWA2_50_8]OGQ28251.1 MAG: primosomal protein N' [Deltaproteobacteria bacterium RIFCSPHIGHO2_02_FULL_50_15]OGQ57208.1 MAG: primosomal protein N' [Deltaproteobacteria bacterium RIFCSPLOWO2_02_FULL_50_16]OGQ66298.1 MAG: primosomal protein N' [Deltaproteobacteria bacterium RIFCSPLOWO2_12_FULL_50_11]